MYTHVTTHPTPHPPGYIWKSFSHINQPFLPPINT